MGSFEDAKLLKERLNVKMGAKGNIYKLWVPKWNTAQKWGQSQYHPKIDNEDRRQQI